MHGPIIDIKNLNKSVYIGDDRMPILKNITCKIQQGDCVVLYGPPGSGKSIFLYTLLGIEPPTSGEIYIESQDIYRLSECERTNFRRKRIGIVYGHPLWISTLNVLKNIEFSLHLNAYAGNVEAKAIEILEMVGMKEASLYHPADLDNLQQQKIAVARAMVTDPDLIVADDPMRHLHPLAGHKMMQCLQSLTKAKKTVLIVTDNKSFLSYANRPFIMDKGQLREDALNVNIAHVAS